MSTTTTYADWGALFYSISPYAWAYLGIALALGASVIGAAWYIHIYLGESSSLARASLVQQSKPLVLDLKILSG